MEILEKDKQRKVADYNFLFKAGATFNLTVDEEAGDTVTEEPEFYAFSLVPKVSVIQQEKQEMDAEYLKIFKTNLAVISIRKRMQRLPSEEELFDLRSTVKALASKTIQ